MSEQVDIAVDLGAVPPALPEIVSLRQFAAVATPAPPQIIEGILHQGCKMILGGTSKSNKSWCLLDLALSVASGQPWWGRRCEKLPVVYINFELHDWAIAQRVNALCAARSDCKGMGDTLHLWNLRGHNADLTLLRPKLEEQLAKHQFGLIILDPAYKVLGNRDENANGEIASLMNELEAMAKSSGAAVVVAHHFAKGDSTAKSAMDRMSGAGAWARDPDSIVVLTPHEEENCFTVTSILRNLPQLPEFVVSWDYPLMRLAADLNPDALRRPQSKNKVCSDKEFVEAALGDKPKSFSAVIETARSQLGMSPATAKRYLNRLKEAEVICQSGGLYWAAHQGVGEPERGEGSMAHMPIKE
ncbi:MAG: AAA family ATPase [Verrucomicrobia bacterium]|nr:MAG: AAA family ATPase [Verrucomicrobiota bacterium]